MARYRPPIDDVTFLLGEVFDFDAAMAALPGCEEADTSLAASILEDGGKFCAEVPEPPNRTGDEEGCRLEDGQVTTPPKPARRLPMGIHAQPTCVMNYDGAIGWLVGEPGRGLNAMFTMMNAERLFVGVQGLGIGEAANQKAVAWARKRSQGRSADVRAAPYRLLSTRTCARC